MGALGVIEVTARGLPTIYQVPGMVYAINALTCLNFPASCARTVGSAQTTSNKGLTAHGLGDLHAHQLTHTCKYSTTTVVLVFSIIDAQYSSSVRVAPDKEKHQVSGAGQLVPHRRSAG